MPSNQHTYVYMLNSIAQPEEFYTGCTTDLESRLGDHNRGHVTHTKNFCPWRIEVAIAFRDAQKARKFEKYLKSGSGREFARRHFR